jgi:hypothetical protein
MKVAVKCLSTDFTIQKGIKGIPLYLQIGQQKTALGAGWPDWANFRLSGGSLL